MEIINRYVYAVTRSLPEKGREEIEKEIKALIYELMEKYPDEVDEEKKVSLVINELGDPEILADKYREKERYLIGPKYFNKYILVLKIVIFAIFIGVSVGLAFSIFFSDNIYIGEIIANYMGTVFSSVLQGAAWVTIIFVIMEKNNVNIKDGTWSINSLPQVPTNESKMSKGESIAEIIFSVIFLGMLYYSPQVISIYFTTNNETTIIPVFNMETVKAMSIIILITFTLIIIKGILKLIWGNWTMNRAVILSVLEASSAVCAIIVFSNNSIWNNEIATGFEKYAPFSFSVIINGVITIIIIAAIIDVITNVYKGYKSSR